MSSVGGGMGALRVDPNPRGADADSHRDGASTLAGLATCLKIAWRRNRLFWILWVIGLALLMPATASQYDTIIPPGTDPRAIVEPLAANGTMLATLGPAFDLLNKGGFVFWRSGGFTSVVAGLVAAFGIIRATRAEEEEGHVELLRSGPVGRHAPTAAAMLVSVAACLALAVLNAGLLIAMGLPAIGSFAAGLALGAVGILYVGVGSFVAQLFESARTARYWAAGFGVGVMYLLRAMIDGAGPNASIAWLKWLVPVEWGMLVRPFADERWWVFALPLGFAVVFGVGAFVLESRRDHGAGLWRSGRGRATAPGYLSNAWGLAWRLQRGGLIGWTIALLLCAVAFGSIGTQMESVFAQTPGMERILQQIGGTDQLLVAFNVAMFGILVTMVAFWIVLTISRLRSEETHGHAELMLSTATSRWTFALSHLLWALILPVAVSVGMGALVPIAQAAQHNDWTVVGDYARGAAGLTPALVFVAGLAMFLIGWAPRLLPVVWVVVGWSIVASWWGALIGLPDWLVKLHPWGYLAHIPRDAMDWTPFLIELGVGVVLLVLGLIGYRRRNLDSR